MISKDDNFYSISDSGEITRKDGIPMPQNINMQEMCEEIVKAGFMKKSDGSDFVAEEIFNSSQSGELWHIFPLYLTAIKFNSYRNQAQSDLLKLFSGE